MTRSSSTATRRRGVALAAAVGVLTLGAMTSASAAGPSHTASVASAHAVSKAKGPKHCAITEGRPVSMAKAAEIGRRGTWDARATTKAVRTAKTVKPGERSAWEHPTSEQIRAWKCSLSIVTGKPGKLNRPGKPGEGCRVLVVKGADSARKNSPAMECHATYRPATPKKR